MRRGNRGLGAACIDSLCHSERSIEDAESKNPLLFDGTFTPHPPRLTPGHLPLKGKALVR